MATKNGKIVDLQAVTMIDPATGWIEFRTASSDRIDLVSTIVELLQETRNLIPYKKGLIKQ